MFALRIRAVLLAEHAAEFELLLRSFLRLALCDDFDVVFHFILAIELAIELLALKILGTCAFTAPSAILEVLEEALLADFEEEDFVADVRRISLLARLVHERAQLALGTVLPLLDELLAHVGFVLVRVIQPLESRMRIDASLRATKPCFLIIFFAFLRNVEYLIRRATEVERLVSIDAVIPVMILQFIVAPLRLVPVKIKQRWLNSLQIVLQLYLRWLLSLRWIT